MSVMDIVRKWSEKKNVKKAKFKEAQEDMQVQKLLEERQKSSNERELERYMKEQREADIKRQLDSIRKKQRKELWSGRNSMFHQKTNILNNDKPILKEKNIFKMEGSMFLR